MLLLRVGPGLRAELGQFAQGAAPEVLEVEGGRAGHEGVSLGAALGSFRGR
jgi:hypothetical protein